MGEEQRNPFTDAPPVGDFFAPFFTVEFTNYDESGTLSSSPDETRFKFTDGASQFRSFATSLEIVSNGSGICIATLVIEPPFYDAIHICEARVIQQQSIMSCQWGYLPGGPGVSAIRSRWHHFVLSKAPSLDVTSSDVTITIVGTDLFSAGAAQREDHTAYVRNRAAILSLVSRYALALFQGTRTGDNDHVQSGLFPTDLSVLEHLAAKFNMKINTSLVPKPVVVTRSVSLGPLGITVVPDHTTSGSTLLQERPIEDGESAVLEQRELDWSFFLKLCRRNNLEFFTIGGVIYLADKDYLAVQQASYRLVLMQQPRDEHDIPLMSFSTNAIASLFHTPAAASEVRELSGDPDTGEVLDHAMDPAKLSNMQFTGEKTQAGRALAAGRAVKLSDGTSLIPNPVFTTTETGRHVTTPHGQSSRDSGVEQIARQASDVVGTNAQATAPGVPSLVPLMIVQVSAGFPTTFDGPYRVIKVTHRLGSDGYDMEIELKRDTTSASPDGAGTRPATGGNNPDVRESGHESSNSVNADGKQIT